MRIFSNICYVQWFCDSTSFLEDCWTHFSHQEKSFVFGLQYFFEKWFWISKVFESKNCKIYCMLLCFWNKNLFAFILNWQWREINLKNSFFMFIANQKTFQHFQTFKKFQMLFFFTDARETLETNISNNCKNEIALFLSFGFVRLNLYHILL